MSNCSETLKVSAHDPVWETYSLFGFLTPSLTDLTYRKSGLLMSKYVVCVCVRACMHASVRACVDLIKMRTFLNDRNNLLYSLEGSK